MWLCAVDVDEGYEEDGELDLCLVEDVVDKGEEVGVEGVARG